ncbi:MAG: type II toxin-antitoxin system RatA family toxin [Pseudomonadota bacterium]
MPTINRHALVPFSAEQMYTLVNAVDDYAEFLPGCKKSTVLEKSEHHMRALMLLSKAGIEKELTTHNELVYGKSIIMRLDKGPFKSLEGIWDFTCLGDQACRVELKLDFQFKNKITEKAFGKIFIALANSMVEAFTKRAKQVYGKA